MNCPLRTVRISLENCPLKCNVAKQLLYDAYFMALLSHPLLPCSPP
jgi:hypothetical protein